MSGLAKVTITRGNGNLTPAAAINDGESLLVLGVGIGGWETVMEGVYSSYAEFATKMAAYPDSISRSAIFHQVRHFFLNASGQKLHILNAALDKTIDAMLTPADTQYVRIHNYITAQNGKIKLVGLVESLTTTSVNMSEYNMPTTNTATVTKGQTFAELHASAGRPFHLVIGFYSDFSKASVVDLRALAAPRVSVHSFRHVGEITAYTASLGTTTATELTIISKIMHTGYVLGKIAGSKVQENIGKVANGSITTLLAGAVTSSNNVTGKEDAYTDAGFIVPVQHPGKDGYYFNDDPTCVTVTDDYAWITRNRIINKAENIAREVYTNQLNNEIDIDPTTGKISAVAAKALENEVSAAIKDKMVNKGECVAVEVYINPDQDVLTTSKIEITIAILPKGYARYINVLVKFTQTVTA